MQSDQDMQSDQNMHTILKDQFITLIKTEDFHKIREITETILYNSFCVLKTNNLHVSLLYRLIFHTYKENPLTACHILSGFIKFGQSEGGQPYKPMIDYFVVEAFNYLLKENGWVVLKPCVIALREINYNNEPLFQHMITCIVKQLDKDINEMPYSSDLCYNLPREKSFSWGWFSYVIARAYYDILFLKKDKISAKQLRNIMMLYRKLLTKLRKNSLDGVRTTNEPPVKIEENWNSILSVLSEYCWATELLDQTLNDEEEGAEPLVEESNGVEGAEPLEEPLAEPLVEESIGVEGAEPLEEPLVTQPIGVEGAEPLEEPLNEKHNSWLYKLFGW